LAVPPDSDQREVTEATFIMGRPIQSHHFNNGINNVVYWTQRHPRAKMMVVHFNKLVAYLLIIGGYSG
jgi:hypothetical protein